MNDSNNIDAIALFNTFLGLSNMEKNTASQEHSKILEEKIDMMIQRLECIESLIISEVVMSDMLDKEGKG